MKVENTSTNRLNNSPAEHANAVERATRAYEQERTEALGGKDHASFSERARILAKARAQLDETSDVRAEKVSGLRQQVESGAYQVPVEELVKRLMERLRAA
ncbi:MAG: flagellar biosynthesis anti-sigma factor FlgM [Chloroflexi bacterium]|nr:flagellar biosynthesis anti-sigma factor FlgM [Chloroflexota bacterium]